MGNKIWFNLEKSDWHNHSSESMWADRINEKEYKLLNIPLYAYGISYNDTFSTIQDNDGTPIFHKIIKKSWNSTYRIIKNQNIQLQEIINFLKNLENFWVSYESQDDWLFVLNIPLSPDINLIYTKLEEWEKNGLFWFEEADYFER